jgi:hypothetical protein
VHKSAPTVICLGSKRQKASKVDDAPVPTFLWDNRIDPELEKRTTAKCVRFIGALETTRKYTHRVWLRLVVSSFWAWIKKEKSRRNLQCLEYMMRDRWQYFTPSSQTGGSGRAAVRRSIGSGRNTARTSSCMASGHGSIANRPGRLYRSACPRTQKLSQRS